MYVADNDDVAWSYGWNRIFGLTPDNANYPLTQISQWAEPSKVIIVSEAGHRVADGRNYASFSYDGGASSIQSGYPDGVPFRHNGRRNSLFLDGSVRQVDISEDETIVWRLRSRGWVN